MPKNPAPPPPPPPTPPPSPPPPPPAPGSAPSPSAPRRSTRIKRRAEEAALAAVQSPPKRPAAKPSRASKPSTKPALPRPSPGKVSTSKSTIPAPPKYIPSDHTLFLNPLNFLNVVWTPPAPPIRRAVDLPTALANHSLNVQEYFSTKKAGVQAAAEVFPAAMYRHIGTLVLEKFKLSKGNRANPTLDSTGRYVNMMQPLKTCSGKDTELIDSLYSLAERGQKPYPSPYIVALSNRKDFEKLRRSGTDLTVQLYLGRMLFELIGFEDTKRVFANLDGSKEHKSLPKIQVFRPTIGKSPEPSKSDRFTLAGVLRRAENLGYASLTKKHKAKLSSALTVQLYPFQEQTVRWMLDKENDEYSINQYFWEEHYFTDGSPYYYFPKAGEIRLCRPPDVRGGMVTEEMGLGKTVEALALIAAQKTPPRVQQLSFHMDREPGIASIVNGVVNVQKLRVPNRDFAKHEDSPLHFGDEVLNPHEAYPKTVKVRRYAPRTTLVVSPKSLIAQWKHEAEKRAPGLSLIEWEVPSRDSGGTDCSVAVGEHACDIVLATYEQLQKDPILSKINWRRLILDEAQVTRRTATQVARDTFNLRSESRFLMTGTPIVGSIDDLRGELAFLKVWPFTLENDGFWDQEIRDRFQEKESTELLDHLLSVTMMRHTKQQQLSLGLPVRSYETIEVELSASHRAIYCFILGCCLEEITLLTQDGYNPRGLRTLLRLLMSLLISPSLLNLSALDLARRAIWARRSVHGSMGRIKSFKLQKMSPTEAIRFLAETGSRIARDSNRNLSTLHSASAKHYEQFIRMDIDELRTVVEAKGLTPSHTISHERLAQLAAGGVHRLSGDTLQELQTTIIDLAIKSTEEAELLSRSSATAILASHYASASGRDGQSGAHEAGFAALTRLIEQRESPSCPVCLLGSMERISMTKCGHFYCVECLMMLLHSSGRDAKCAICRRPMHVRQAVEVTYPEFPSDGAEDNENDGAMEEADVAEASKNLTTIVYKSDPERYKNAPRPTSEEVWKEYQDIGQAPARFRYVGRNAGMPALDPDFLQHVAAATSTDSVSPKLFALRSLIQSCSSQKFCVVAETETSLRGIWRWLTDQGISSVGVGTPSWACDPKSIGQIARRFASVPSIRVFLLNTANSTGLTLTSAQIVVLMEPMLRISDEMQATARVHRIGQTQPVKIIRLVTRNTIEEQIMYRRGDMNTEPHEVQAPQGRRGRRGTRTTRVAGGTRAMSGRETRKKDLIRLFRDLTEWEEEHL